MGLLGTAPLHFAPLPSNGWGPRFPVNPNRIKYLNGFLFLINYTTLEYQPKMTRNLPEMKLCLKWHNLSLLYIWRAAQEAIIKKC